MKEANQQRKEFVLQFARGRFLARPGPVPMERGRWPVAAPRLSGSSDFKRPRLRRPRVAYLSTPRHLGRAILFLSRKDKAAFIVFSPAEWVRPAMPAGAPLTVSPSLLPSPPTTSLPLPLPQKPEAEAAKGNRVYSGSSSGWCSLCPGWCVINLCWQNRCLWGAAWHMRSPSVAAALAGTRWEFKASFLAATLNQTKTSSPCYFGKAQLGNIQPHSS